MNVILYDQTANKDDLEVLSRYKQLKKALRYTKTKEIILIMGERNVKFGKQKTLKYRNIITTEQKHIVRTQILTETKERKVTKNILIKSVIF